MTTNIYLDVDGVLNAVHHRNPSEMATGWDHYETKKINGWPIRWAPGLVERLNKLATREDVVIKWLTTWKHDAAQILAPDIGLEGTDWPVLDGDLHMWHGADWWKLVAIQNDVEDTKPDRFIWIDDDISHAPEALVWLAELDNGLVVSPFTIEGLTRNELEIIEDFVKGELEP